MIEQHFLQGIEVAVNGIRCQWVIFVKVEYDYIAETQAFFFMHADEGCIYVAWRVSSCQCQHTETSRFLLVTD